MRRKRYQGPTEAEFRKVLEEAQELRSQARTLELQSKGEPTGIRQLLRQQAEGYHQQAEQLLNRL